jgi:hypothetical protein
MYNIIDDNRKKLLYNINKINNTYCYKNIFKYIVNNNIKYNKSNNYIIFNTLDLNENHIIIINNIINKYEYNNQNIKKIFENKINNLH